MERVRARLAGLLSGFWLVPGGTALALALAAFALVAIDRAGGAGGVAIGFDGDARAARGILTAVAGSLITVVALTLSLTVVTLQLVAGQFTPRAVRGLMADRLTQVVAGVLVGSVAYALVVLRAVREPGGDGGALRPALSTSVAIVLALVSLGLLIVFVHHIARVIQVSSILDRVGRATLAAVERLYPGQFGTALDIPFEAAIGEWRAQEPITVARPSRPGYVQAVAVDDLAGIDGDAVRVAVHVAPGDFVTGATSAIEVWGAVDPDAAEQVGRAAVIVADERDLRQDARFGLRQLADIAVRALSPGINDPTTATTAAGWARAVLEVVATRELAADARTVDDGRVTVAVRRPDFDDYLDVGLMEIGRHAVRDARVSVTLLDALASIGQVASAAGAHARVDAVVALARDLAAPALEHAVTDGDRRSIGAAAARVGRLERA